MPHIPIPPSPTMTTQQMIQKLQQVNGIVTTQGQTTNIAQPNSNVAQQIKDVAEQKARMVIDEWMKQYKDLFESKETKLKIKNIQNIVGQKYDDKLTIIGVLEEDKYYEFHLNTDGMFQAETILLHRRQTDSGHYIMEYNGKTLWVTKDEIDMPEKIIICMQTL